MSNFICKLYAKRERQKSTSKFNFELQAKVKSSNQIFKWHVSSFIGLINAKWVSTIWQKFPSFTYLKWNRTN